MARVAFNIAWAIPTMFVAWHLAQIETALAVAFAYAAGGMASEAAGRIFKLR